MATKAGGVRESKPRLTKDQLLEALRTRRQEYELDGVGTITIESISVDRFAAVQGDLGDMNTADALKRICLLGVVEPALSPEDLEALGAADVGIINDLANAIMRVSGLVGDKASRFLGSTKS
jgi:hypothetical protein